MSAKRWLGSPLAGTAGVLAGLCLIAIPLRKLTSAPPAPLSASRETSAAEIPSVLRVKLLAPANRLLVKTADGAVLLDMQQPSAGESEHDAMLPIADGELYLVLLADFGDSPAETAVFLTVMPDGIESQTRYATGSGLLEETLRYEWHHEH
jgi:hypothetical protein